MMLVPPGELRFGHGEDGSLQVKIGFNTDAVVVSLSPMNLQDELLRHITNVPDFPQPGIVFKDITPVFLQPELCNNLVDAMARQFAAMKVDAVVGLESRGFLLGMPLALKMGLPFVMARKKGKLPRRTYQVDYALEYGTAGIEIHTDALQPGSNVLIHDDVLATGGTARAAAALVEAAGARVAGCSFLVEIVALPGRKYLSAMNCPVFTFVSV